MKLSIDLDKFLLEIKQIWNRQRPIEAFLKGSLNIELSEDISDDGLSKWRITLKDIEEKLLAKNDIIRSSFDEIVVDELKCFINNKLYQLDVQQPYHNGLLPYIHLFLSGMLPFFVIPEVREKSESKELFYERTKKSIEWFNIALKRNLDKNFEISHSEISLFQNVWKSFLSSVPKNYDLDKSWVEGEFYTITSNFKVVNNKRTSSISLHNLEILLKKCCNSNQSIYEFSEEVTQKLYMLLEQYKELVNSGVESQSEVSRQLESENISSLYNKFLDEILGCMYQDQSYCIRGMDRNINYIISPDCFDAIVPEALYLPKSKISPALLLISSKLNCNNKGFKNYFYHLLAHEIFPGHHEHYNCSTSSPLKENLTLLNNSFGLEGWAVKQESAISELNRSAKLFSLYYKIKRLIPVCVKLSLLIKGKVDAEKKLINIATNYPQIYTKLSKKSSFGINRSNIAYVMGWLETEKSIKKLEKECGITKRDALKYYSLIGPISPINSGKLAKMFFQSETSCYC